MDEHLGYGSHEGAGRNGSNSRNGRRGKTLLTEVGAVDIAMPRDRDGTLTPVIVPKRSRRLGGIEDLVASLSAKGLTHGEICAHLAEVSKGPDHRDHRPGDGHDDAVAEPAPGQRVPGDLHRPCPRQIRDGQVANRSIYIALAVTVDGDRDILGLWAGDGAEGAKFGCGCSSRSATGAPAMCAWVPGTPTGR